MTLERPRRKTPPTSLKTAFPLVCPSHPLVAASHVEQALVDARVDTELGPLVVHEERLLRDGARVRPRAQQVDRLDLAEELIVQALYKGGRGGRGEEEGRGSGGTSERETGLLVVVPGIWCVCARVVGGCKSRQNNEIYY